MNRIALLTIALSFAIPASAAEIDWSKVDQAMGRKGAEQAGGVHRYGFPRSDLHVTVDGVAIKPALALGGWVAFAPLGSGNPFGILVRDYSDQPIPNRARSGNGYRQRRNCSPSKH